MASGFPSYADYTRTDLHALMAAGNTAHHRAVLATPSAHHPDVVALHRRMAAARRRATWHLRILALVEHLMPATRLNKWKESPA
jgi:hypothetical protein